jgi:hypothetical protein
MVTAWRLYGTRDPPFWAIPIPEIWPRIAAQIQLLWRVPFR